MISAVSPPAWFSHGHTLKLLEKGDAVCMRPLRPGEKEWRKALVVDRHDQRSYTMATSDGGTYRRNRVHLRKTQESPPIIQLRKGRQVVKGVLSECVTCKKMKGKPYSSTPTAALPEFRVREAPPFSRVGVDFAGPFYVKSKKGEMEKGSCCVTRAVHLKLVVDLSAAAFRRCLRRFTARHGTPALIVFDNTKTFQASEKALNELFNHPEVRADLGNMRVEWKFNLEREPRMVEGRF